jgi:phosphoserine phosphatase RsbX
VTGGVMSAAERRGIQCRILVVTSDGIDEPHLDDIDCAAPALTIAERILHSHAKDSDDALVLTARHRGVSG